MTTAKTILTVITDLVSGFRTGIVTLIGGFRIILALVTKITNALKPKFRFPSVLGLIVAQFPDLKVKFPGIDSLKVEQDRALAKIIEIEKQNRLLKEKIQDLFTLPQNLEGSSAKLGIKFPDIERIVPPDLPSTFENFRAGIAKGAGEIVTSFDKAFGDVKKLGEAFAKSLAESMSASLNDFFFDVIEGRIQKLSEVIVGFLKNIARALVEIFTQKLVAQFLSALIPGVKEPPTGTAGTRTNLPSLEQVQSSVGGLTKASLSGLSTPISASANNTNIKIELINETGTPLQAKQTVRQISPSDYIISVVIDGLDRNRMGLRNALGKT